ncbi:HisA/HisF-related TIM barrel protein [Ancylobacter sp. WKF20]|uniref:HisA/HisF-related TIM barrel protein n=1 Tax=Ancylobacter sp. WKF20 TaxID=3039801 RepID=UPI0024341053|nr:HisA/HisF-related TIM barrel protein [Ancylobacter sp. WKF20]WGD30427.1 HisA/HisF-related TIM barrel protein [Ancylobacter sp. WKF20]
MELIPVLDLMGGVVVHARRGMRAHYRPIATPLCPSAEPAEVAASLLALAPFRTLYIADLDAIARKQGHGTTVRGLMESHPGVDMWVDAGEAAPQAVARRAAQGPGRPVVGSEAMADLATGSAALAVGGAILSLDYGPEGPRGPALFHEDATLWPEAVIVMTLTRVGAGEGPDLERLGDIIRRAGNRRVYAAGGVRDLDDLTRLADAGAAGVLLASALHDGRLSPDAIARFMG